MKDNLFYIVEEDGRCLTMVNGIVTSTSEKKPIKNAPAAWRDIVISWERNAARYGLQRSFTSEMGFVNDAATILRHTNYNENYERKLYFLIQQLTPEVDSTFFSLLYKYLYKGEIDLTTAKNADTQVTCAIMEGGVSKLLKANEGTQYEIPFDDDAINIKMDGVDIDNKVAFSMFEIEDKSAGFTGGFRDRKTVPIFFINREGIPSNVIVFASELEQISNSMTFDEYMAASGNFLMKNVGNTSITVNIKGSMSFTCLTEDGSVEYIAEFRTSSNAFESIFNSVSLVEGQTFTQEFDFDIVLNPADKLFSFAIFNTGGGGVQLASIEYKETSINFSFKTKAATTYIKAFQPYTLFQKLMQRICGNASYAQSDLLQLEKNITITCGDAIRGIEGAKLKISFNQFLEHCLPVHFAGQGIKNDKVLIENRAVFYDTSNPIALGTVSKPVITLAKDLIANTMKIGWRETDIEDVNGKNSFNGYANYSTSITRVVRELPLLSPMGADPYEIEQIRINLDGKTTTDSNSDNKLYAIDVAETPLLTRTEEVVITAVGTPFTTLSTITFSSNLTFLKGQRIRIESALNNIETTVVDAAPFILFSQIVAVADTLVSETAQATVTILSQPVYTLRRDSTVVSGLPAIDSIFNVGISPARIARKNGPWLRSILHPFDNKVMKYEGTQRNRDLVSTTAGVTITEAADFSIYSLGNRLFLPHYVEFTASVPAALISQLEEDPNRCFEFEMDGYTYRGFNMSVKQAVNTEAPQEFKLLLAPDTDLSKFVK